MAHAEYGNKPGEGPLRKGGVSVSELPVDKQNLPSTPSKAATAQAEAVELVRDCWGGTPTIRTKTTRYLPKGPGEKPLNYSSRLNRSVFTNVFRRTVELLAGFVFRKDPVLDDDVPAVIRDNHWENIDNAGTHGDVFLRDILQDAMVAGHAAILVEFPDTESANIPRMPNGKPTREADIIFRPYWVPIKKENILSWRTTNENGKTVLTQLVLKEEHCEPDGQFGEKEVTKYRVFYRNVVEGAADVGFALLSITSDRKVVIDGSGRYPTQIEIPVAEIPTSGRRGLFESDPPLQDLAHLNIAHYQQWSDRAHSIYKTCVPLLFLNMCKTEEADGELTVGPNTAIVADHPDADMKYVAHDGSALEQCTTVIRELVGDMAQQGVAALASEKRSAETEGAKRMDKGATDSALAVTARGLQDGTERALGFHARYINAESGGSIQINRDFESPEIKAELINALKDAVRDIGLPERVFVAEIQKGGIAEGEDAEELALEMQANKQAIQDAKELEMQQRADALHQNGQPGQPNAQPPQPDKIAA